ncbi:hypothetical protein BD414DRAFT_498707 [Trametes punicea]|nr:hypothetical protein BD414DRAFT_498707 [Trametes punicea]
MAVPPIWDILVFRTHFRKALSCDSLIWLTVLRLQCSILLPTCSSAQVYGSFWALWVLNRSSRIQRRHEGEIRCSYTRGKFLISMHALLSAAFCGASGKQCCAVSSNGCVALLAGRGLCGTSHAHRAHFPTRSCSTGHLHFLPRYTRAFRRCPCLCMEHDIFKATIAVSCETQPSVVVHQWACSGTGDVHYDSDQRNALSTFLSPHRQKVSCPTLSPRFPAGPITRVLLRPQALTLHASTRHSIDARS